MRKSFSLSIITLAFCFISCSEDGGSGGSDNGEFQGAGPNKEITTSCGVVQGTEVVNPFNLENGAPVTVTQVVSSNLVKLTNNGLEYFVKLHGIGTSINPTAVKNSLASLTSSTVYLAKPTGECTEIIRGGSIVPVANLITESGTSFTEHLINSSLSGSIDTSETCGANLISSCYSALKETAASQSLGEVSDFLWKPSSESPFNPGGLSILTNPCNVKVLVNGEELRDYGGTNGRCVTARSSNSGCSYGNNVRVEVLDIATNRPYTFNGEQSLTISNGCDRVEVNKGGSSSGGSSTETQEACEAAPATAQYRPALDACGGNAAVILSGDLSSAFSVQLRLSDDSDRLDPNCSDRSCTPYKAQSEIDGAGSKTYCFGAPGTSPLMTDVTQTTVKLSSDDSTPERFCIPDPSVAIN